MSHSARYLLSILYLYLLTAPAYATVANAIPEPSVLSLIIAGGIVGAVVAVRKRRK